MSSIIALDTFDHIGFVVEDAKAAAESWSAKLGISEWKFTDAGVLTLAHARAGAAQYELLEPKAGTESLWAEFLKDKGEGLHHICHTVPDVEEARDKLVADGGWLMASPSKYFAYVKIGGPNSVILELLRTPKPKE